MSQETKDRLKALDAAIARGLADVAEGRVNVRVELNGRWTKGMTVANFERGLGMNHFGGTALEQVNYRHNVAMKLDDPKFCDLIVDAPERLTSQKA